MGRKGAERILASYWCSNPLHEFSPDGPGTELHPIVVSELLRVVDSIAFAPDLDGSDRGYVHVVNGSLALNVYGKAEGLAYEAHWQPRRERPRFSKFEPEQPRGITGAASAEVIKEAIRMIAAGAPFHEYLRGHAATCESTPVQD